MEFIQAALQQELSLHYVGNPYRSHTMFRNTGKHGDKV